MEPLTKKRTSILVVFGLAVLASGMVRYFGQEGGEKGLWFGVVMGGIALTGGFLVSRGLALLGLVLGWLAVLFVIGWFGYEALILKGVEVAETRQLIILGAGAGAAVGLCIARGPGEGQAPGTP